MGNKTAIIKNSSSSFPTDMGEVRVEVNPRTAVVTVSGASQIIFQPPDGKCPHPPFVPAPVSEGPSS